VLHSLALEQRQGDWSVMQKYSDYSLKQVFVQIKKEEKKNALIIITEKVSDRFTRKRGA
jgi:hypothetical protein